MKHLLLPVVLLLTATAVAQDERTAAFTADAMEASVAADISALNQHFEGIATFRIDKRQRLVIDYLDQGRPYRTDVAYCDFLDASTCAYNSEEKTLMLHCQDPRSKCIDKELHEKGSISPTGRINLPVPGSDPEGARGRELLSKLVNDKQSEQLTRLAETNTRGGRKN